jgi:hypothetical protein
MTEVICKKCGHIYGSNPKCDKCQRKAEYDRLYQEKPHEGG